MDWIVDGIALGSWEDARDHGYLRANGIQSVLQFYGPDPQPDGFPFAESALQVYVLDARPLPPELIRQSVDFIREQRALARKILVACGAGMSRSASFLAAYLHEEGMELTDAFLLIRSKRRIMPHPEVIGSLLTHYGLETSPQQVVVALVKNRA